MEKVKVKHLEKANFAMTHGETVENFAAGEERELPVYVAELLLREEIVERKWDDDGKFLSEKSRPRFEVIGNNESATEFAEEVAVDTEENEAKKTNRKDKK